MDQLVAQADDMLYLAKANGRNRIESQGEGHPGQMTP